jgi:hypothetical protein
MVVLPWLNSLDKNFWHCLYFRESLITLCDITYLRDGFAVAVRNSLPHRTPHTWGSLFSHPVWRSDHYFAAASESPVTLPVKQQPSIISLQHLVVTLIGSHFHNEDWASLWWIRSCLNYWSTDHCQSMACFMLVCRCTIISNFFVTEKIAILQLSAWFIVYFISIN